MARSREVRTDGATQVHIVSSRIDHRHYLQLISVIINRSQSPYHNLQVPIGEMLPPDELFSKANELSSKGTPFAVVSVTHTLGSTPREVGTSMLVKENGEFFGTIGGGNIEKSVIDEALKAINGKKTTVYEIKSLAAVDNRCGGAMTFFINVISPRETMVIFGAGHIAKPTGQIGKVLGYRIVIVDPREEFANPQRFPDADLIVIEADLDKALSQFNIDENTYIVVVTHDHLLDERILEKIVGSNAAYIGMIGSEVKAINTLHSLKKKVPVELLEKVKTPMGLNIGAETPEEIAVSIIGEITRVRRGGTAQEMAVANKVRF